MDELVGSSYWSKRKSSVAFRLRQATRLNTCRTDSEAAEEALLTEISYPIWLAFPFMKMGHFHAMVRRPQHFCFYVLLAFAKILFGELQQRAQLW